jgi:PAS domain S-box-containing protein
MTPSADTAPAPPVKILLVDDEAANLLALEAILGDLGQTLVAARSGDEALHHLLRDDFAVVLLDVQMQGLDGFDTAKLIRGRPRSRHTPIIFLTAYDHSEFTPAQAYGLGAVDFLVKPLVPVILRAKVAVFVELFQKTRQVERQAEQLRRTQQEQAERRALAQYVAAGLLAESATLRDALPGVLRTTCETLGWDAAGLWTVDRQAAVLRCVEFWHSPDVALAAEFAAASRGRCFAAGEGLPGRVWAGGEAAWITDVTGDANFPRAEHAARAGLRGACAVPVRLDGTVVGVLEFMGRAPYSPDEDMQRVLLTLAHQVGQFLERRRAEEALRASEEQYRRLAEFQRAVLTNMGEGMYAVDAGGRVTYLNPAAEALFGWPGRELLGRKMHDATHHHHPDGTPFPAEECDGLRVLRDGVALTAHEDFFIRKDGAFFPVVYTAAPIRTGDEVSGLVVVFRDDTERRRRTEELAEANRHKDEFLAMLAHELRNPLAALLPSVHILRQAGASPGNQGELIERMERQLRHLGRMVDDLLDVSRLTRGQVQLRLDRLDLARLVRTAAEDRRPLLEQAGLTLAVQTPQTPVWVQGDATRLAQVLNNLLDNAAKFTERGGRVDVGLAVDERQRQATVTVRDTGVGIDPDMLPRIWTVFAQADRSLDRARGGLGLGLAVVRGLVELHGGQVHAASAGPGRGAEFTVRLPVVPEPPALTATTPAAAAVGTGARLRVLIVEDNRDAAESLKMLLELLGHETRVASTGPEGVRAAKDWTPDIVLCDIGLPGLDGYGVARELRLDPTTARARLVALTGYGSDDDRRRSRQAGFDHHLTKPAEPEILLGLLVPPR